MTRSPARNEFTDAPSPKDGMLAIPARPGLGLSLDRDAVRETEVRV